MWESWRQERFWQKVDGVAEEPGVRIAGYRFIGLERTKLDAILQVLQPVQEAGTLAEAVMATDEALGRLHSFGCFKDATARLKPHRALEQKKAEGMFPTDGGEGEEQATVHRLIAEADCTPRDLVVELDVEEASKIQLQVGTEVDEKQGGLKGSVTSNNLFGRFEKLTLKLTKGTVSTHAMELSLSKPILSRMATTDRVGGEVYSFLDVYSQSAHSVRRNGFTLDYSTQAGASRHTVAYEGAWRNVYLDDDVTSCVRLDGGHSVKSSLKHTYLYDDRDSTVLPTTGNALQVVTELAGFGGTEQFIKNEVSTQINIPLPYGLAINSLTKFGWMRPLFGTRTNINDRFFSGGPMPLRGFHHRSVAPKHGADSIGGELTASQSLHLSVPLPKELPESLKFHCFTSIGNCTRWSDGSMLTACHSLKSFYRASVGVGLVLGMPNCRIELNLFHPIRSYNDHSLYHWQLGGSFNFL